MSHEQELAMAAEPEEVREREQRLHDILDAYAQAVSAGRDPDRQELLRRNPELAAELQAFFAKQDQLDRLLQALREEEAAPPPPGTVDESTPAGEPIPPAAGTTVRYFGDYELLEEIARGG